MVALFPSLLQLRKLVNFNSESLFMTCLVECKNGLDSVAWLMAVRKEFGLEYQYRGFRNASQPTLAKDIVTIPTRKLGVNTRITPSSTIDFVIEAAN